MVGVLPQVVGEQFAARWEWNLRAMWLSGLRLGETFHVYWEQTMDGHFIRPRYSETEAVDQCLLRESLHGSCDSDPPDFAEFLREVPSRIVMVACSSAAVRGLSESVKTVGKRISETGKLANVVLHLETSLPHAMTSGDPLGRDGRQGYNRSCCEL